MKLPARARLAQLPTPIHPLPRLSKQLGRDIFAWRDDLTGFTESGNKIRKLEFLVGEALAQGATWLVSCGGPQSNHARATAFVARRLGLGVSLMIRQPKDGLAADEATRGNFLLDRILGAQTTVIDFAEYVAHGAKYDVFLQLEAERLRAKGERPYVIAEGGSSALGCFGYVAAIEEMLPIWREATGTPAPDAIVCALGSGGTYAGLHLGVERAGLPSSLVHAVNVCDDARYFERRIHGLFDDTAKHYGAAAKERAIRIHDGFVGGGYAKATDEELRFYAGIARGEGLLLDPCYTGKAFRGMVERIGEMGKRILFLHSGGGFGNFAYGAQWIRALG